MFEYEATLLSIHDGDTIHVTVELGLDERRDLTLRLYGINAPELDTTEGKAAKLWLQHQLPTAKRGLIVRTVKDRREKYGRYLATVLVRDTSGKLVSINEAMVATGHAVVYLL